MSILKRGNRLEALVGSLIRLERDLERSGAWTIERMEAGNSRRAVERFHAESRRHLKALEEIAREEGLRLPATQGGMKHRVAPLAGFQPERHLLARLREEIAEKIDSYESASVNIWSGRRFSKLFDRALSEAREQLSWYDSALSRRA